jgi:predicted nuclease of restriction endonuclease-like (RecB) superfamily
LKNDPRGRLGSSNPALAAWPGRGDGAPSAWREIGLLCSVTTSPPLIPADYAALLADLKERVRSARLAAAVSVNRELVKLYWSVGRDVLARQAREGWGAKVIDRLATDLRAEFPEMKGFSPRNLKYMRSFAEAYPDAEFVQTVSAQLTWSHNTKILDSVRDPDARRFYLEQAIEHGWSLNVLANQIDSDLFHRHGKALTNFHRTLPAPQSELAQQLIKDPYSFEFLAMAEDMLERDLEKGLLDELKSLIMELGKGFAFVGSQYHLEVGGQDYYLDLLFYHLKLRCYVVIELKIEEFKPEFAGKMNFYLSAVDDQLRHADDQPSIGIILCRTRNKVIVEYALRDSQKPMGVAEYTFAKLPKALRQALPSSDELSLERGGLSLITFRIELEREIRRILPQPDGARSVSLSESVRQLVDHGLSPQDHARLVPVIALANRAAHGLENDRDAVLAARDVGQEIITILRAMPPVPS